MAQEGLAAISHSAQRVGVFVDAQNIYHSAKNLFHGKVSFKELLDNLVGDRHLIRAIAYVVRSEGVMNTTTGEEIITKGEDSFFEALQNAGLELRMKDLQVFADGMKKADWDVGIAVDAIRMANFLDVVILVTGDGDYIPLVEYLKWGTGRQVEVAGFARTTSSKLKDAADTFIELDKIPRIIIPSQGTRDRRKKWF